MNPEIDTTALTPHINVTGIDLELVLSPAGLARFGRFIADKRARDITNDNGNGRAH
ncbi:MAG TPA: hypothetical protein VM532_16765 [Burkholderiales bacterium]|nr:hypothetical protein [Burkholderiales bacterium]